MAERDSQRYASSEQRKKVLERHNYQCAYCGRVLTNETANIDHIKPWKHGGRSSSGNFVAACQDCNKKKGNRRVVVRPGQKLTGAVRGMQFKYETPVAVYKMQEGEAVQEAFNRLDAGAQPNKVYYS